MIYSKRLRLYACSHSNTETMTQGLKKSIYSALHFYEEKYSNQQHQARKIRYLPKQYSNLKQGLGFSHREMTMLYGPQLTIQEFH